MTVTRGAIDDLILFGSSLEKQFVLETVFVVAGYEDYTPSATRVRAPITPAYDDVTIRRIWPHLSYRLYWGATYADPFYGMYSFFPRRPASACPNGFPRPQIADRQFITGAKTQGYRLNPQGGINEVQRLWEYVRDQIMDQHLDIGVYAQVPDRQRRDGSSISTDTRPGFSVSSSTEVGDKTYNSSTRQTCSPSKQRGC